MGEPLLRYEKIFGRLCHASVGADLSEILQMPDFHAKTSLGGPAARSGVYPALPVMELVFPTLGTVKK
jgi:hypothetical protein